MASLGVGGARVICSFLNLAMKLTWKNCLFHSRTMTVLPGWFFPSFPEEMNSTGYGELVYPVRVDMFKEYIS